MSWIGNGINYGHQSQHTPYDFMQVAADFAFLKAIGVTKLRIAYPSYDGNGSVAQCQALVQFALNNGFYVIWGATAGGATVTNTRWAAFKGYVTTTLAPWAQSLNNANLQLSVGNEEELHVDGTTVTAATIRSDVSGSYSAGVKAIYTKGLVSYETAATQQSAWASLGKGNLDKIGFNVYYELDPAGTFTISVNSIVSNFGSSGYVSEWSTSGGYTDLNSESAWAANLSQRQTILQSAGVGNAYYFCFRDGGFGITADTFALLTSTNSLRVACANLVGKTILRFT